MRTPILSIIFFVKQMIEWLTGPRLDRTKAPQSLKYCTIMLSQLEFLQSFVNDLLDLAQLKNGVFSLNLERLRVQDVIEFVHTIFQPHARSKNIQIDFDVGEIPALLGDVRRLKQVIINLVKNAIKFTTDEPEGRI